MNRTAAPNPPSRDTRLRLPHALHRDGEGVSI